MICCLNRSDFSMVIMSSGIVFHSLMVLFRNDHSSREYSDYLLHYALDLFMINFGVYHFFVVFTLYIVSPISHPI